MNSEETSCNFCIYSQSPKNTVSCPMEGKPEYVDGGKLLKKEGPEIATTNCLYYTCDEGANVAASAIEAAQLKSIPTLTINYNNQIIEVAPFETRHKKLEKVYRMVEIQMPHRLFLFHNDEIHQMSDRLSNRVRNILRLREKKALANTEL